ncbi:MAG: hypothetical protein M1839_003291 [Geoglossum umbratile]|nr:MAG: hypothetical protein M1839_003291 [Geoglossum umbratile]
MPLQAKRRVLSDLAANTLPSQHTASDIAKATSKDHSRTTAQEGAALDDHDNRKTATDLNRGIKRHFDLSGEDESDSIVTGDESESTIEIDQNCDQIRRKIRALIDSGEVKIGEFCKAIDVSNKSYNDFLRQNGRDKGMMSNTFIGALRFFQKREAAGVPLPRKKAKTSAPASTKNRETAVQLNEITLPGEQTDSVEVYDSCDEIRRKINAHLKKDGVTQASFLRDLRAQYHTRDNRMQSTQLQAFRGKKGPAAGNTSSVFYAAYVFFEKLRIKEGKKKSKHREAMEGVWAHKGGFDTEYSSHRGYWAPKGASVHMDQYGLVRIS